MREWLLNYRKSSNLTQQNVADCLGISKQFYQQIETGQRVKDLDSSMIMAIANVFKVSALNILRAEQKYQKSRS